MAQQKFIAEPKSGTWVVRKASEGASTDVFVTQEAAWSSARRLARGAGGIAELKSGQGRVLASNTYRTK
ncbi:MAG: DUF2188 domain-containing protein [Parvibaculum sp.]|nr:DUF2188 domain-containing protein [Parvibaculum sp.]